MVPADLWDTACPTSLLAPKAKRSDMCELLGMSANVPTDICFSFTGLMQRGGKTGPHRDGWGITFYEGKGCRSFHDANPSANSEIARLVQRYPIKSDIVISHIRRANRGRICLENTHPFTRELWGKHWVFAHNGQLAGIKKEPLVHFKPVGTTDSEYAFCWILDQLMCKFKGPPKSPLKLSQAIGQMAASLNKRGVFNMLLSDSTCLYTFCSTKLYWLTRKAPFSKATLIDAEMCVDFKKKATSKDVVTVIATRPLTEDELWHPMDKGEFQVFSKGKILTQKRKAKI